MSNIILTEKIRVPNGWVSPFEITDGNQVLLKGSLKDANAVSTNNIRDNAITASKITNNAIQTAHIANGQVTFNKLDNSTILKRRIEPGSTLNETDIADNAIRARHIVGYTNDSDNSARPIDASKIQNSSIISSKIADGAITVGKLYEVEDDSNDSARPIGTNSIKNYAITTNKIASQSITSGKLYTGENNSLKPVTTDTIKDSAVTAIKITDGAIVYGKLYSGETNANKPVVNDTIQNNTIQYGKLYESLYDDAQYNNRKPIVDDVIQKESISLRKLSEPLYKIQEGPEIEQELNDLISEDAIINKKIKLYFNSNVEDNDWKEENIIPVKYSHTSNINDGGIQSGNYNNNENLIDVVTIPGALGLEIDITYETENQAYDWACMWLGDHPEYSALNDYPSSLTGKLGGTPRTTQHYIVEGNSVTFGFKSDPSVGNYGYYAVITGIME